MTVRRIGVRRRTADTGGNPPARKLVRNAKLAALPVAFAGRQMAGAGKRALGRSSAEVDREIQLRTAQHIFEVLGELKGCAAKLGQVLGVYELALPPELAEPYRNALSRLQNAMPPMLPATVHGVLAEAFGPDWRGNFREFDDRRTASATIGQVHRAVWHDGRAVAVKIMYPGARAAVDSDLDQLRRIAPLASVFVPNTDVRAMVNQLALSVRSELDYAAEAESQRGFALAYADDPDFRVPRVLAQRGDVIVSEWLDGIPLTRMITAGAEVERARLGILSLRFVWGAATRTGRLYGDPHPGNFLALPDGRLGVVDFGACLPWPPPSFGPLLYDVADAVFNGTPAELRAAAHRHGFVPPHLNFDVEALLEHIHPYAELLRHDIAHVDNAWLRRIVLAAMDPRLDNVGRQLTMPTDYVPFWRSFIGMVGLAAQLGTTGPIRDEILRWSPELTAVLARYRERTGGPADLRAARLRRAAATDRDAAVG
ncbi:ABC1 kinase family protein [Nocardia huaxiensis]|uniref:AarF/ABC1/UbiB kinase family protein n=1 Tax=Nocardia huaxiensis TaxID=2755382 RepID=A0A7D6V9K7_9NOCA|nr:AarF/UbiB family protein [Nocardia huaxiensis]QLY27597.1 AarF/ABC1/UbiB kinase family protein [Nocardia huaxiensis]UFS99022.1 AarF/UbiB family protein [Nocardia huaxiensis]